MNETEQAAVEQALRQFRPTDERVKEAMIRRGYMNDDGSLTPAGYRWAGSVLGLW